MSLHSSEVRALEHEADVSYGIADDLKWSIYFLGQNSSHELVYWERRGFAAAMELEESDA